MSVQYKILDQQVIIPVWTKAPILRLSAKPTQILGARLKPLRQHSLGLELGSFITGGGLFFYKRQKPSITCSDHQRFIVVGKSASLYQQQDDLSPLIIDGNRFRGWR
jgi:hypothetical protein